MATEPPVAIVRFQSRLVAVTGGPLFHVADQPWVTDCPEGSVKLSVQPSIGAPLLVTVRLAVNPPTPGLSVQGWAW